MNIQEIIIKEYPLTTKIECELNCYLLDPKRYLVFWDDIIEKDNINNILNLIEKKTNNNQFSEWKTIVVIGNTSDDFEKSDLLYFNNVNTFVVFYLVNEKENKVFMNDSWIFTLGLNYKKSVRKINEIVCNKLLSKTKVQ